MGSRNVWTWPPCWISSSDPSSSSSCSPSSANNPPPKHRGSARRSNGTEGRRERGRGWGRGRTPRDQVDDGRHRLLVSVVRLPDGLAERDVCRVPGDCRRGRSGRAGGRGGSARVRSRSSDDDRGEVSGARCHTHEAVLGGTERGGDRQRWRAVLARYAPSSCLQSARYRPWTSSCIRPGNTQHPQRRVSLWTLAQSRPSAGDVKGRGGS